MLTTVHNILFSASQSVRVCLIVGIGAFSILSGEELDTYRPSEHPANTDRQVTGFTRPAAKLIISAEDSAKLLKLPYEVGMTIGTADDMTDDRETSVVAILDNTLSKARWHSAQAQVQEAEGRILQIKAEIARSEREVSWWQSELKRFSALASEGRASQRQVDETTFRLDQASLSRQSISKQLISAKAALLAAQANLAQRKIIVDRHQLRAPTGWVVTKRHMEPQALASPGQGVIELADTRTLEIELRLTSQETAVIERAAAEDSLSVELGGSKIPASLHAVSPDFDAESRKHIVLLRISGNDLSVARGGLAVKLTIALPDPNGGLLIPFAYTRPELDQWLVFNPQGEPRPVTPLRIQGDALVVDPASLDPDLSLIIPPKHSDPNADSSSDSDEVTE